MDETQLDPLLCMQGVMFTSDAWQPGMCIVKMIMHGFVSKTQIRYGMVGGESVNPVMEYA